MSEVEAIAPAVPDDLDLDGDGVEGAERGGFSVNTEAEASWALSRLLALDDEEARIRRGFELRMADLEKRRKKAAAFFLPMIEAWFRANPPKGKAKSIKLLDGVVGTRASKGGAVVKNDEKALEWARTHLPKAVGTRIDTVTTLDKVAIKEHVEKTKQPVPGVELVGPSETFFFKAHGKGGSDG